MASYKLTKVIIDNSQSDNWDQALLEWILVSRDKVGEPLTCECGHYPIMNLSTIRNKNTNKQLVIGSCCVKKFIAPSNKFFLQINKVCKDISKLFKEDVLELALKAGVINEWESNFVTSLQRVKFKSEKQQAILTRINTSILVRLFQIPQERINNPTAHKG